MSLISKLEDNLTEYSEGAIRFLKYDSLFNVPHYLFEKIMNLKRGSFPFYTGPINEQAYRLIDFLYFRLNNFVHFHETERELETDVRQNMFNRIKKVGGSFHIYSNDTMANLMFCQKLPKRDYDRLYSSYNQLFAVLLATNSLYGVGSIALLNFALRTRKASLPLVFAASLIGTVNLIAFYNLSYKVVDSVFNQQVRRLGYGHLVVPVGSRYLHNIEYAKN